MRLFARILWIAAFLLATYSWMVAFEHGFGWKGFSAGFQTEWKNLGSVLSGKGLAEAQQNTAPTPTPSGGGNTGAKP
jgi:hypothetical protein